MEKEKLFPLKNKCWELYGKGFDNFGRDGKVVEREILNIGEDEILMRVDAVGLCYSDIKIINSGSEHPRLKGRNLQTDPVVPGHEVAMTVIKAGDKVSDKYRVGSRYIVQADIYYKGKGMALGYMLRGGMSEYIIITKEVIESDYGDNLIPVEGNIGYSQAALVEPWTCVEAAYRAKYRTHFKDGGALWIIGDKITGDIEIEKMFNISSPAKILLTDVSKNIKKKIQGISIQQGIHLFVRDDISVEELEENKIKEIEGGFDDIVIIGTTYIDKIEFIMKNLKKGGILSICKLDRRIGKKKIDFGRIHYDGIRIVGSASGDILESYNTNTRTEIKEGGNLWLVGAGGPMGQMHLQRAIMKNNPPSIILVSDINKERLNNVRERFEKLSKEKGVNLIIKDANDKDYEECLERDFKDGFDDIVVMVPSPGIIGEVSKYGKEGCVINIFAGVGIGSYGEVNIDRIVKDGIRYLGTSGSTIEDMKYTLEKVEKGELDPDISLSTVGGLEKVKEALENIKEGKYTGKVVIYPHLKKLGLLTLEDIKVKYPEIAKYFKDGKFWSKEAERKLIEMFS